eukprot:5915590-Prymnesium_polylepis.1
MGQTSHGPRARGSRTRSLARRARTRRARALAFCARGRVACAATWPARRGPSVGVAVRTRFAPGGSHRDGESTQTPLRALRRPSSLTSGGKSSERHPDPCLCATQARRRRRRRRRRDRRCGGRVPDWRARRGEAAAGLCACGPDCGGVTRYALSRGR